MVKGDGSMREWFVLELADEEGKPRASMASEERGVELTRLSSGARLAVVRKAASADLRSALEAEASASALAAVEWIGMARELLE